MSLRHLTALSLLVLTVGACGTSGEPVLDPETRTDTADPTREESPLSPPPTPPADRSEPTESPATMPYGSTAEVVAAAKERLAGELNVSTEAMEVVAIEPVEWRDGSLGCPEPGQAYVQVITPGYRIRLRLGERMYEVHTDSSGQTAVMCLERLERGPAAAVAHVAAELDVPREEIEILSSEAFEWPDASLGCPEPGKSYAQVITPGYRVILQAEGEEIEVHTDWEGRNVVICAAEP